MYGFEENFRPIGIFFAIKFEKYLDFASLMEFW